MEIPHEEHLVDVFDAAGQVIGQKKRSEIDKKTDIVHGVYIFVFSPKNGLWIADLSATTQNEGKLGCTAAGIVRHGETIGEAARRTLARELNITSYPFNTLGTEAAVIEDGSTRILSVITLIYDQSLENRDATVTEFKLAERHELGQLLNDRFLFAPTFLWAWEKYQARFPF